jgi:F0F1-type ATP synthase delta subunit
MIASVGFKPINETTEDEDLRKFLAKQSKKQTGLVTEICKGYHSQVFERLLNVV